MTAEALIAVLVGLLVAIAVWLMTDRSLIRFLLGLIVLSNAANMAIFAAGGMSFGLPALIPDGLSQPDGPISNPLPQALILTAIVIGFALVTFVLVLVWRLWTTLGSNDPDMMGDDEPATGQVENEQR